MRIGVIASDELSDALLTRWRELQEAHEALASPYFCPEFTHAVGRVRDDVFVAVIEDGGQVVGFFPFQRGRMGVGTPVGGRLCDFQGVIGAVDLPLDATALLRACGLSSFDFSHLVAAQRVFATHHSEVQDSHYMDLTGGFDAYQERLRIQRSKLMKEVRQKRRKIEELGAVRFVPHCDDVSVLHTLQAWKSSQYQTSGLVDVFSFAWTKRLLEEIHSIQTPTFSGMLSALYLNDQLIAAHMGMRSGRVWNWWFPRHDPEFHKLSPGILLRMYAAESAADFGVTRMDLGAGDENTYKPRLRTGGIPIAAGRVERLSVATALRRVRQGVEQVVRRSPLLPLARIPGRWLTARERRRRFE